MLASCRLFCRLFPALRPALFHCIGNALTTFRAELALALCSRVVTALGTTRARPSRTCSGKQGAGLLQLKNLRVDLGYDAAYFHEEPPGLLCVYLSRIYL